MHEEIPGWPILAKSTKVAKNRYGVYPDAARILFYEKYKAKQCGTNELFGFFDDNRTLNQSCAEYKIATKVLNCLEKCFPPNDGPYDVFEKHAWVFAVYGMIRELQVAYSLIGHEQKVGAFVRDFHGKVYNEDFRGSNTDYQRFYDNIRGGWSEKIVALRRDTLIKEFLAPNTGCRSWMTRGRFLMKKKLRCFFWPILVVRCGAWAN